MSGFAGVPWGATTDSARAVLGEPDSLSARGDTTSWHWRREFASMPAEMWLSFTPGNGLHSGGYTIQDVQCGADFTRVSEVVRAAHPELAEGGTISQSPLTRSTDRDSVCASGHSLHTQLYLDPEGRGGVAVLLVQTPGKRVSLVVAYAASLPSRRVAPPAGGVHSRADGVEITLMPGFPALRELSGRRFVTLSSDREVRLTTYEAHRRSERRSAEWRLSFMDSVVQGFTGEGTSMGTVRIGEQLLYVDFRMSAEREGDLIRIGRIYATREGPFRMFAVMYAQPDSPDADVESAVTRLLDSVRLAAPAP